MLCTLTLRTLYFSNEIDALQSEKFIHRHSKILKLGPFLDQNQNLPLNSNIKQADECFENVNPIIFGKNSIFSISYARQLHEYSHHSGTYSIIVQIRKCFWMISAKVTEKG